MLTALTEHPSALTADRPPPTAPDVGDAAEVSLPTVFSSEPRRHRDPLFLAAKKKRLWEPHVAPVSRQHLMRLLDLAPALRVVVALGRPAQRSIARLGTTWRTSGCR